MTGFYVNDNGDNACYGIVDGGSTGVISSSANCNNINTTTVMTNSGMMVVGGVQGAGSIGGLPTSIGGVTTAGGSTANTYGFYVLNNGAYIDGTTNGTQIIGVASISGLASLDGGASLNNQKITNLAPGTAPTDAVNLSQLNAAVASGESHYYSVNDGGTQGGNFANDGATGLNAIAGGVNASASGAGSVVMGSGASDNGNANATVLGGGASIAAGVAGSNVALGQGSSVTAAAVPTSSATIAGQSYSFAGGTPAGVVSVGTSAAPRQMTNVAAGQLSAARHRRMPSTSRN